MCVTRSLTLFVTASLANLNFLPSEVFVHDQQGRDCLFKSKHLDCVLFPSFCFLLASSFCSTSHFHNILFLPRWLNRGKRRFSTEFHYFSSGIDSLFSQGLLLFFFPCRVLPHLWLKLVARAKCAHSAKCQWSHIISYHLDGSMKTPGRSKTIHCAFPVSLIYNLVMLYLSIIH